MDDVIVVGSGPTGAMAAAELVSRGCRVTVVDFGADDAAMRARVPDLPFGVLRREDPGQRGYLLGDNLEGVPRQGVRVGAQLTAPRQFVNRAAESLLPIQSSNFFPMQSLALGGLGAAWGTACFTFSAEEYVRAGLDPVAVGQQIPHVIEEAGVSGPGDDQCSNYWWGGAAGHQPPLDIDSNSTSILQGYAANSSRWLSRGFALGRIPLAVNSRMHRGRGSNPYYDMDFYGDARRSAYRPRYTIERLLQEPNFRYLSGFLALRFSEGKEGVELVCAKDGEVHRFKSRRLILCAGAIGSARLALASRPFANPITTILSCPYVYFPTLNLRMLGRAAGERRHSLAQLAALYGEFSQPERTCSIQMYSYRSLLLFKLVKEMPLAPWAGLVFSRAIVNALAIFGVFFPDEVSASKTLRLGSSNSSPVPDLLISYSQPLAQQEVQRNLEAGLRRCFWRLGCVPLGRVDPGTAGSIHYGGTIPKTNPINPGFHTLSDGRLGGSDRVFVGDTASWNWMPCKGPTFVAMAASRAVAGHVATSLAELA